jgi:molecular chaperone GrpE
MSNEPEAQDKPEDEIEQIQDDEAGETVAKAEIDQAMLEVEIGKARDELLRALADADNTRKRAQREVADARAYAIDKFARDLLPVADTLSRALAAISPQARAGADETLKTLLEGVEMTERTLMETFTRNGLRPVGEKGDVFDPNLHQAVAQAPSEAPAGTLAEVMQAGYVLGERTVRPAMVVVSTGPAAQAPSAEGDAAPGGGVDIKV